MAAVEHYANSIKCKNIISTNGALLNLLISSGGAYKRQNLDDWAGSLYERNGITYLFLNPLRQFFSVNYGKFIAERFISKLIEPHLWERTPDFSWELLSPDTVGQWYENYRTTIAIAVDIETYSFECDTTKEYETVIRCICFTGLWRDGRIHTVVIPIAEAPPEQLIYWVWWMRKFCELKIPKILQNGLYDHFHLLCYGTICWGYIWDTQSLFHSWYSELPKRLDFIGAFCVHNIFYWKDMVSTGRSLFEYNARDGWATMVVWMYLVKSMPDWAIKNYQIKFPLWVPCLVSNLEGDKIDGTVRERLINEHIEAYEASRARLRKWFGPYFNPNSSVNVKALISFYGSPDIPTSGESDLRRFALRHPLNARFVGEIIHSREIAKRISESLKPSDYSVAAKPNTSRKSYLLWHGRLFSATNPDGTDTGRLSCSIGSNWTGAQQQNRNYLIKEMYIPESNDWLMGEVDGAQAEARCVAYKSGDKNLLEVVESGKDYHAINAERFFGIPYDKIVDDSGKTRIVLNKRIRDLSKRTNHGANYNMGPQVLLETMGEEAVDEAKKLLNLEPTWTRLRVCAYLLECYSKAYPTVKGDYYKWIVACVKYTHMLVSDLGWTRYCFGNPERSKPDLNAVVAHVSQHLSVAIVNKAFAEAYWDIQSKYPTEFRIKGQIHDSIRFQVRKRSVHLVATLAGLWHPAEIKDIKGTVRTMRIPTEIKLGPNWKDMKTYRIEDLKEIQEELV